MRGLVQGLPQELFVDHIWSPFWGSCISDSKPAKVTWDRAGDCRGCWLEGLLDHIHGVVGAPAGSVFDFVDFSVFLFSSIITPCLLETGCLSFSLSPLLLPVSSSFPLPSPSFFHLAIPIQAVKLSTTERGLKGAGQSFNEETIWQLSLTLQVS